MPGAMDSTQALPPVVSLSPSALAFFSHHLHTSDELAQAKSTVSELQSQCHDLDASLADLNRRLGTSLFAYASFSDRIHGLFSLINSKLTDLTSSTRSSDGRGKEESGRAEQMLAEELPALAKEVARVETVRNYAETALKLDSLVGDIEDAVSSATSKSLRKQSFTRNVDETRMVAIETLKLIEEIITSVTKARPLWIRLVSAVDHRVDRALAILRPQAIADHRALLTYLGWPPPLSALSSSVLGGGKSTGIQNPLFTMQGDLKDLYCENFLALCKLQVLQTQRKHRQLEGYNTKVALQQPLWAIEELVNPISVASQRHFSKWLEKPEFIFALVYKITRDFVDPLDNLLQPLVDEAMLVGYSCREEWISCMVTSLSTYLAKERFPVYVGQLNEDDDGMRSQARVSWLHLVDLMIAFDKRIQSLVAQSGIILSLQEDGNLQKISSLCVFNDRPDWLDLWAEIELSETLHKLKVEIDDERNWSKKIQGAVLSSGSENFKSPLVSSAFLRQLSSVIDHCRSLPDICLRSRFLKLAGVPIIQKFTDCLLNRCQEAEGLTALTDDDALIKVANSINASHYIASVLMEWCEDVFFIEMSLDTKDESGISVSNGIFDEEIRKLEKFRSEWVEKIAIVVLRGFDAKCRDYIKNKKQWQEKGQEGGSTLSRALVDAVDHLQGKMSVVEGSLNGIDFVGVWRSLAAGVDSLFFNGILMSHAKFHDEGVQRFGNDLEVLFGVFGAWCLRPQGFFPKTNEGLELLKNMKEKQLEEAAAEIWMKENGIRHLSVAEVQKIAKNRLFVS